MYKIGNVIEEVVDLSRQINLEVDSDDVQELLNSHNQELTMDELIEMHEKKQDCRPARKTAPPSCYMLGSSSAINVYILLLHCTLSVLLHLYFICSQDKKHTTTTTKQDFEEESLDPVQSEDRMMNLGGRTGKILRPSSVALKSKNQEINRLQLAVKLPWAIFFESVDILS
ncbi:hypothetical protein TNCV_2142431 [Trichonephila clavipes]|nr:hypothetical protein TNCV_2142431 [Trichonephila clavipes]